MYPGRGDLPGIFIGTHPDASWKEKTYRLELPLPELLLELEELLRLEEELTELRLLLLLEELRPTDELELLLLLEPEFLTLLLLGRLLEELPELELLGLLTEEPELLAGRLLLVEADGLVVTLLLGRLLLVELEGRTVVEGFLLLELLPVLTLGAFGRRSEFTDTLGLLVFGRILTELKSEER